jgi:geranylgeranyl diphosphate synthase type I
MLGQLLPPAAGAYPAKEHCLMMTADNANRIVSVLEKALTGLGRDLREVNPWGEDVCRRLIAFSRGGKMLRGRLVVESYLLSGGDPGPRGEGEAARAAAALELIHAAFLIHDDIMDQDSSRRGAPALFAQYQQLGREQGLRAPGHFGHSMGICAGDVALFLAFRILSSLKTAADIRRRLLSLFSRETSRVAVAQMQDVYHGARPDMVAEEEIFSLYLHKTARYTFSLPLMAGSVLAGRPAEVTAALEKIGETLGIIFQIKDDELGLFGSEARIGKPAGSDVREGKKTLYHYILWQRADAGQKKMLSGVLGKQELAASELAAVRRLVDKLGVRKEVGDRVAALAAETQKRIRSAASLPAPFRTMLLEFLDYNLGRGK